MGGCFDAEANAKGFVYVGGESCAGYEHCGYRPPITVISSRRYNGLGQLVWEGNQTAETSYAYDRLGRVSSRTTSAWFGTSCEQYSYTYTSNPSETVTTVTADTTEYPSTRVVYTYDTADRLVKTEAYRGGTKSPAVLTTSYDAVGRVARTGMGQAYDYVKEFGEGVDRMCRELSAIGTKEPQYHLVAFIMKATVWANILEERQEKTISDQKRPDKINISLNNS